MEKIKQSAAAKTTAFILLQIFVLITVCSAMIAAVNLDRGWYIYDNKERQRDMLYHSMAVEAQNYITVSMPEAMEPKGELILGENQATGFGYEIYVPQKDKKEKLVKQLHLGLKTEQNVYTESFQHGDYRVQVYLAHLEERGSLPFSLEQKFLLESKIYQWKNPALWFGGISLLAGICLFVFLMMAAGHRNGEERPRWMMPLDLVLVLGCFLICMLGSVTFSMTYDYSYLGVEIGAALAAIAGISSVITGVLILFAAELKQGGWLRRTLLYRLVYIPGRRLLSFLKRGIKHLFAILPLIWKSVLILAVLLIINLIVCINWFYDGAAVLVWFLEAVFVSVCVIYIAWGMKQLAEGARRLAEGDLSYRIDKKGLILDLEQHADNLNRIREGMAKAVEERTKSDRFKAELITNVSHDIKTPLTSIINYVDFLKKEELHNEKAREYVEVLDRQAGRLKKLTEDLVDASKAATGNVSIDLKPCQVDVLMTQTMGEYEEKAKECGLNFIMKMPEESIEILADGRRLWRVFDNLLNNICKYAQPGTRVYMTLQKEEQKAVITYRNISKYELDITEEELMERFVRGDSSRHTEGSGLGLSIARNLVELQGGTFHITIDGDLFKAVIEFPLTDL